MRKIASFSSVGEAERFRWILQSCNIACHHESDTGEAAEIWILSEDDREQAKELLQKFKDNPDSTEFVARAEAGKKALQDARKTAKAAERQIVKRSSSQQNFPVTLTLVGLALLIFIVSYVGGASGQNALKIMVLRNLRFSLAPGLGFSEILDGQIWRLVSPIFLHGDIFHIFFNMLWLWQLARQVEGHEGSRRLLALVVTIAVSSHVVFYLVAGPQFGGMSGVNYGLFCYIWFMDRYGGNSAYRSDQHLSQFFLVWYVLCLVLTVFGVPIANTIHGVGACAGLLFAFFVSGRYRHLKKLWQFNPAFTKHLVIALGLLGAGIAIDFFTY